MASATNVDLTINKDDINQLFDKVQSFFIYVVSQIINVPHALNSEKKNCFRKFKESLFLAGLKIE